MDNVYDFAGWATRNNVRCSDGRTIMKDAFKHNDGVEVPLVWNHQHNDVTNVLGHAMLENREEGVYAYCYFNDTETGQNAKELVLHGDVNQLSIFANQLKQQGGYVMHGNIREVSLVLAGANPEAYIESVIKHGEESDEEALIFTGEDIVLYHADCSKKKKDDGDEKDDNEPDKKLTGDNNKSKDPENKESDDEEEDGETIEDIVNEMSEKQQNVLYGLLGKVLKSGADNKKEEEKKEMKHNVFDQDDNIKNDVLSHADQQSIISMAKQKNVGSLQTAITYFAEDNDSLAHGIDDIDTLFPEYKDVRPGAPEFIERDQGWVGTVMNKTHKSPISRIRTRQADITGSDLRAYGYNSREEKKKLSGNIKLLSRTTDPQTIYRRDALHRDDIIDITDFDVVDYQYRVMRQNLDEEIARAIMIGDGRTDGDADKIDETHIRSILNDDELYTIHAQVDLDAAKTELQGTNTSANFSENYIYAEAIIKEALYAREKYKGSGTPDYYCTPHSLNVMLLAKDLNGRRIYNSVADIAAALNVNAIYTAEQFEGVSRIDAKTKKSHKLLGIFVNLADYQLGSTKGGEITKFNQFDIDFNQEKYLIETRLSGALTRIKSAIVLEEPGVTAEVSG